MGSILMHVCISEQLSKKYSFSKKFILGSLLPDIYKRTTMTRDESHYIKRSIVNGFSYHLPDLEKYVEDHRESILTDEITLGYYAHLVEDYVWFKYVSGLFTKVREDEEEKELVRYRKENFEVPHPEKEYCEEMYKDYSNVNEWLLQKCQIDIEELADMIKDYTNDEYSANLVRLYCKTEAKYRDGENAFLNETIIERYIKASVELFELNYNKIKKELSEM